MFVLVFYDGENWFEFFVFVYVIVEVCDEFIDYFFGDFGLFDCILC